MSRFGPAFASMNCAAARRDARVGGCRRCRRTRRSDTACALPPPADSLLEGAVATACSLSSSTRKCLAVSRQCSSLLVRDDGIQKHQSRLGRITGTCRPARPLLRRRTRDGRKHRGRDHRRSSKWHLPPLSCAGHRTASARPLLNGRGLVLGDRRQTTMNLDYAVLRRHLLASHPSPPRERVVPGAIWNPT